MWRLTFIFDGFHFRRLYIATVFSSTLLHSVISFTFSIAITLPGRLRYPGADIKSLRPSYSSLSCGRQSATPLPTPTPTPPFHFFTARH